MNDTALGTLSMLPQELRDKIYSFVAARDRPMWLVFLNDHPEKALWYLDRTGPNPIFAPLIRPGPTIFHTSRALHREAEGVLLKEIGFRLEIPVYKIYVAMKWLRRIVLDHGAKPFRGRRGLTLVLDQAVEWDNFHHFVHLAELTRATDFDYVHPSVRFHVQYQSTSGLGRRILEAMALGRSGRQLGWSAATLRREFDKWARPLVDAAWWQAVGEPKERARAELRAADAEILKEQERARLEWEIDDLKRKIARIERAEQTASEEKKAREEADRPRLERRLARQVGSVAREAANDAKKAANAAWGKRKRD